MAETSNIAWTKSTHNPWIGCTKVGPGCDHCYAEALDARKRWDGGKVHWGVGVPRYRTSKSNWQQPIRWNNDQRKKVEAWVAGGKTTAAPEPWRVFCASLADVFDNEVPAEWRRDLWDLVKATPYLNWLIVTKRIGNVRSMVPESWLDDGFPDHVRIMITVVNQEEADRDIPKLLSLKCRKGVSYEPALGPVDFRTWGRAVEWVICGGESTQGSGAARRFVTNWAADVIDDGLEFGFAVLIKQLGSDPVKHYFEHPEQTIPSIRELTFKDRAGADPSEWPFELRVQEFPKETPL